MKVPLREYWVLLRSYLKPQWRWVLLLAVLILGGIGLQLLTPQILRFFIDAALEGATTRVLTVTGLVFVGTALFQQVVGVTGVYLGEKVAWLATNQLRGDLTDHCLHLDMGFHNTHTPGELIERIDGDVASLANFFSTFVIQILGNFILVLGILCALSFEDWRISATLTLYVGVSMGVMFLLRNIAVPYWKRTREVAAELFSFLEEHLHGTEDIRANGASAFTMSLLHKLAGKRLNVELEAGLMNIRMVMTFISIFVTGQVLAIVLGYFLYQSGAVTMGTVFMIITYANNLVWPMQAITRQLEDLQRASAGIVRIGELYDIESRIAEGGDAVFPQGALAVDFDAVTFGYSDDEAVLHDISLRVEKGKVLGVLGRTGSGKTTLTRLLLRLYEPQHGAIRLGGVDIPSVKLADLRHHVGMVTQHVQLFGATVRENLTFFDKSISDEELLDIIRELGLWAWYETLENGLDTRLKGGDDLSAGEAQLLAFARVFLKDPGLVILDEASSRLDPATEEQIERSVDRLLEGRTGIVIAHRLATVERADDILILEDGRIREYGNRARLASDPNSHFSGLLRTGMGDVLA